MLIDAVRQPLSWFSPKWGWFFQASIITVMRRPGQSGFVLN